MFVYIERGNSLYREQRLLSPEQPQTKNVVFIKLVPNLLPLDEDLFLLQNFLCLENDLVIKSPLTGLKSSEGNRRQPCLKVVVQTRIDV